MYKIQNDKANSWKTLLSKRYFIASQKDHELWLVKNIFTTTKKVFQVSLTKQIISIRMIVL